MDIVRGGQAFKGSLPACCFITHITGHLSWQKFRGSQKSLPHRVNRCWPPFWGHCVAAKCTSFTPYLESAAQTGARKWKVSPLLHFFLADSWSLPWSQVQSVWKSSLVAVLWSQDGRKWHLEWKISSNLLSCSPSTIQWIYWTAKGASAVQMYRLFRCINAASLGFLHPLALLGLIQVLDLTFKAVSLWDWILKVHPTPDS